MEQPEKICCAFRCKEPVRNNGQRYCDKHHAEANAEYRKRVKKNARDMKQTLDGVVDYFKRNPDALTDEMKSLLTLYKQDLTS